MPNTIPCPDCHGTMRYVGPLSYRLGKEGLPLMGTTDEGALEMEMYCCNDCGVYRFYESHEDHLPEYKEET